MNEEPGGVPGGVEPLARAREGTIEALCDHFANDVIPVEEFERRIEAAHRAGSSEELRALLRDLPGGKLPAPPGAAAAPASRPTSGRAVPAQVREHGFVGAIMGGASRRGRWVPARRTAALAMMGGVDLDFREAVLPPGTTEVYVLTIMGGVDIVVPPGVNVETHGVGLLGGFDDVSDHDYDPGAPTLRISGVAVMGGVDITVRYPGESARDAKRRRRGEQKAKPRLKDSWG